MRPGLWASVHETGLARWWSGPQVDVEETGRGYVGSESQTGGRNKRRETPRHMEGIEERLSVGFSAGGRDVWQLIWQAIKIGRGGSGPEPRAGSGHPEIRTLGGRGGGDALVQPMTC